jgi:predicted O-methyltransferase YrrM
VADFNGVRSLSCDWACHGSAWLEPTVEIADGRYRPGPVPEPGYLVGWLLAAAARPDGHLLMAGLGSGAGLIALAWAFPRLRITVVEIDPEIIRLARGHFPLLGHFERQGNLAVCQGDIQEHVRMSTAGDWDITCLDAYGNSSEPFCNEGLLLDLHGRTRDVWVNVLDDGQPPRLRRFAGLMIDCGWRPRCQIAVHDPDDGEMCGNILLGTRMPDTYGLRSFRPFADFDHPHALRAHRQIDSLLNHTARYVH